MTAQSFAFTKLVVADLGAAERFYAAAFGLEVRHRHSSDEHAFGQEESILLLPGADQAPPLILTRYLSRPSPPAGAAWTGFVVNDLDQTVDAVRKAGGKILVPITHQFRTPSGPPLRATLKAI